jgi:septal ring factor EnvC (AmiA/AmiB activator)
VESLWSDKAAMKSAGRYKRAILPLKSRGGVPIFGIMKRKCLAPLLFMAVVCAVPQAPAQDSAVEQRLNEISGRIESLLESQEAQGRRISELTREVGQLREHANKPLPTYASQDDLKRLADAVREVDRKRLEDYEKIRAELQKLGRLIKESTPALPKAPPQREPEREPAKSTTPETGFEYVVQKGDTLSTIVKAYRDKNIKVTADQVIKANPGLNPDRIPVGK